MYKYRSWVCLSLQHNPLSPASKTYGDLHHGFWSALPSLNYFPKRIVNFEMECAARAAQTLQQVTHAPDTGLRTWIYTPRGFVFLYFTTLPVLESKSKGGKENGCGPALPSLFILQNSGPTTSWSTLLSFLKISRETIHALSAGLGRVQIPCGFLFYSSLLHLQFWSPKIGIGKTMVLACSFFHYYFPKIFVDNNDVECAARPKDYGLRVSTVMKMMMVIIVNSQMPQPHAIKTSLLSYTYNPPPSISKPRAPLHPSQTPTSPSA